MNLQQHSVLIVQYGSSQIAETYHVTLLGREKKSEKSDSSMWSSVVTQEAYIGSCCPEKSCVHHLMRSFWYWVYLSQSKSLCLSL